MYEALAAGMGVAGKPVPYALHSDNLITIALLLCFVLVFLSVTHTRQFIGGQLKRFFHPIHREDETFTETSGEVRMQLLLIAVNCLLLGIASLQLATETIAVNGFIIESNFAMTTILAATFAIYYIGKWLLQAMVNICFFGSKKNLHWLKNQLFITACFSLLVYPAVLLLVYFDSSTEKTVYYFLFLLILSKSLTFYKCWSIFFQQNGLYLQIILYLCALEITPMLAYGGIWLMIIDTLKINY